MKARYFAAAICLIVCTSCQSNLLSGRFGHGKRDLLSELSPRDEAIEFSEPGLPPPTNRDPRIPSESSASVEEHLRLGEAELGRGRVKEAQAHFERALAAQPQHAKANHRMAVVCDKLEQFQRAEHHYLLALESDPRNVAVLSDLGYSFWLQTRYAESERYLLQAHNIDPRYETAVANLGMLYGTTGRQQEALAMFRKIGDEEQVRQIMEQVTVLAARNKEPAASDAPMTPATPAEIVALSHSETATPLPAGRDAGQTNDPTREVLELMEQARAAQLAEHAPEAGPSQVASALPRSAPPFVQHRDTMVPSPPPQTAGLSLFESSTPAARPTDGPLPNSGRHTGDALPEITSDPASPAAIGRPAPPQHMLITGRSPHSPSADHSATHVAAATGHRNDQPDARHDPAPSAQLAAPDRASWGQPPAGSDNGIRLATTATTPSPTVPEQPWWGPVPPVQHAHHQQPSQTPSPINLADSQTGVDGRTPTTAVTSVPQAMTGSTPAEPEPPATQPQSRDAYEQALRQAAMMGLSAGPGQMFPYVEPTPPSAGSTGLEWAPDIGAPPTKQPPAATLRNAAARPSGFAPLPDPSHTTDLSVRPEFQIPSAQIPVSPVQPAFSPHATASPGAPPQSHQAKTPSAVVVPEPYPRRLPQINGFVPSGGPQENSSIVPVIIPQPR